FACEHYDVIPDMLVIGKGLGGGILPLAALIAREHLDVAGNTALGHYTHEKNPVACAAGLATIEEIEQTGLLTNVREISDYTLNKLRDLARSQPLIGDVRGIGLMIGVELMRNGARATSEAEQVMYEALSRGLNFKVTMGNILTLTPALTITREEMDRAVAILA